MYVDGTVRESQRRLTIRNPYTGSVVGSAASDSPEDVATAIASVSSYDHTLTAERRSRILRSAADELARRREEFARRIAEEAGTCVKEAGLEVDRACGNLVVASEEAMRIHGEALRITARGKDKVAMTIYEPVGVVCAITPFNRPLNQVVVKVGPAIAANNGVVVKPSEKTPLTAIAFAELLVACGLPRNMMAVVTGDPREIGDPLVTSPAIDMVTFTGSVETGERIMAKVGLKKVTMELGGNDPLIVLADANLAQAAALAAAGAFATAGQSCRGVKRILVAAEVADRFVALLTDEAQKLKLGDIFDPATDIGTLIDEEAARRVERRCAAAVRDGAILVFGGQRAGAAMAPAVLDHVSPESEIVVRETFGPVAPVLRVRDVESAIAVSNSTAYGLQAGVVTRNFEDFVRIAKGLRVGAVNLMEGPQFDSPHIPFGGVKKSGIGREGIRYAVREMSVVKTVVVPW
ncbi:MAG: aldehyde dehydrogenase family protein [Isosphaeraceae bacterium]|nr:aldehyde dehydrogenase family protein [Isosphaeraceae bacterium]